MTLNLRFAVPRFAVLRNNKVLTFVSLSVDFLLLVEEIDDSFLRLDFFSVEADADISSIRPIE